MAKGKVKTVKWQMDEPEDLAEFQTNDDIERKNGSGPKRGLTRMRIVRIEDKKNKNKERMLSIMVSIDEKDKKAPNYKWNGWVMFENQNVTQQGAPFLKRFLAALGVKWNDFTQRCQVVDDGDRTMIKQIGNLRLDNEKKPVYVWGNLKLQPAKGNYEERMVVGRWTPPVEGGGGKSKKDDDDAIDMSTDKPKKKGKKGKADDGGDLGNDPNGLDKLSRKQLEKRAADNGRKAKKIKDASDDDLKSWIMKDENLPPF